MTNFYVKDKFTKRIYQVYDIFVTPDLDNSGTLDTFFLIYDSEDEGSGWIWKDPNDCIPANK